MRTLERELALVSLSFGRSRSAGAYRGVFCLCIAIDVVSLVFAPLIRTRSPAGSSQLETSF